MESKYKILALFGPSGAGKDTVKEALFCSYPWMMHRIVACTTRPKRAYEIEGQDYYFLTTEEFTQKAINNKMLEANSFNNWFYGTTIEALNQEMINIGVFNIDSIEALIHNSQLDVFPILIDCNNRQRLMRALEREENPNCHEICRRFLADEQDFQPQNIHFNYITLNNSFTLDEVRQSFYRNQTINKWIDKIE